MAEMLILDFPLNGDAADDSTCLALAHWDGKTFTLRGKPGTVGEYAVARFKSQFGERPPEDQVESYASTSSYGRFQRKSITDGVEGRKAAILGSWDS